MINDWLRISFGLSIALKASHSRWCCRESVIKKETHIQWRNAGWWAVSLATSHPPFKSMLLFEFKAKFWYLFLKLIPIAGQEEGCPNATCNASRGVVWVLSLHPLLLAIACTYFTNSTDFTTPAGISWEIHDWCSLSWFVWGFFRNMDFMSLEFRSSEQKLAPLP